MSTKYTQIKFTLFPPQSLFRKDAQEIYFAQDIYIDISSHISYFISSSLLTLLSLC